MNAKERTFVKTVYAYHYRHGRHNLPWRKTKNPYRVLVSEVMLQQTQVERIMPKYRAFLKQFPDVGVLAAAPLGAVLRAWQGLGYNRRAKMLHACAQTVVREHHGKFPKEHAALMRLPGIGAYTAAAVCAFAYNIPVPLIETNVRSVYIHHFFNDDTDVTDTEILKLVEQTLDREHPREWYWALMDYGVSIKKTYGNPNGRSKHYVQQSVFKGSDRQIRGAIVRALSAHTARRTTLHAALPFDSQRVDAQLVRLVAEGMVVKKGQQYQLPV